MYQKYGDKLDNAAASIRQFHLMMMANLVSRIWGVEESRQVSQKEVEACGHPGLNAPDPLDYW